MKDKELEQSSKQFRQRKITLNANHSSGSSQLVGDFCRATPNEGISIYAPSSCTKGDING